MPALDLDFEKLLAIVREPVESSNVANYGYDELMKVITVEFKDKNSSVYAYLDCSPEDYEALEEAESKGTFLHANIKPNHEVVKIYPR